ncbi:MAG: RagB/SusD family nutrient uptake outer membrane protein [Gemmatimonadetes bacterium]|nr:RagB/SusD family nutrient uptake outer membrane protein [Gemmatimonadota bacterium]
MRFSVLTGIARRAGKAIRRSLPTWLAVASVGLAGCDELLEVDAPGRIDAEKLESATYASLLVESTIGDFECAFAAYIVTSGLVGNVFDDAQLASAVWPLDQRTVHASQRAYATTGCTGFGVYTPLSTSRWSADNVIRLLDSWTDEQVPKRQGLIATAAAFAGYGLVLLGEGMCSAAIDGGPELARQDLFKVAEERFTRSITEAEKAGDAATVNMALVGRARARLNLGRAADAAVDARRVPSGFARNATYSAVSDRRRNRVYWSNNRGGSVTVGPSFRGLTFKGVKDPRVMVDNTGLLGADRATALWIQRKYSTESAPIRIASWEEAQLIIAEAVGGQTAVDIINVLHARLGLPAFSGSDPAEIRRQVIEERARQLFLESHHLGDLIRYSLPLVPPPGTPYPPKAGGVYGDQVCFPLPTVETRNNPTLKGKA